MKNNNELIPCPFCGGKAEVHGANTFWVACESCGVSTWAFSSKEAAIKFWNKRTDNK